MVEYGLRVKNVNGFLQIDGTYSNLALVERITLSATNKAGGPNGLIWFVTRDFPGYVTPTIAVSSTSTAVLWTGQMVGGVFRVTFWAVNTSAFEVYVFDVASRGQRFNINYGLIVKNKTTGQIVFDSRMKYMRILDVIAGSSNDGGFNVISRSYPGLQKVAVVQSIFWAWSFHEVIPDSPTDPSAIAAIIASFMFKPAANSVRIESDYTYQNSNRLSSNPVPNHYNPSFNYIVLDVSNFD